MRLNHIDLHVPDVAKTRDFFITLFDFKHVETRGKNGLAILNDESGLELVISHPIEKFGGADAVSIGCNTYHIGFIVSERREVDAQYERLKAEGAEVGSPPADVRGGWVMYCYAPGRILIEVGCRT